MAEVFIRLSKGIYLSLMLKPNLTIYDSLKITACCGVAVVKAISKELSFISPNQMGE